jgi:hypothetical protein
MIPIPIAFWIGLVVAVVLSLIGALLVIWRGVAGGGSAITSLGALAIAWAVSFGYHLPPFSDANVWLPLLAAGAAVIFSFISAVPGPRLELRLAISAGLSSALGIFLILHHLTHNPLSSYAIIAALAGGLLVAGISWCWERSSLQLTPLNARVVMLAALVGLFGTMMAGGSLAYGFRAALICAVVGTPLILAFWKLPNLGVAAAATSASSWLVVLAYALNDYGKTAPAFALLPPAALIAAAGMAGWIMHLGFARKHPQLGAFLVLCAASLLAIAAISWMALLGQPHGSYGHDED